MNKRVEGCLWSLPTFSTKTGESICTDRHLTMKELHDYIPEVPETTIHEIVKTRFGYKNCVPSTLTAKHKKKYGFCGHVSHMLRTRRRVPGLYFNWEWIRDCHHIPESKKQSLPSKLKSLISRKTDFSFLGQNRNYPDWFKPAGKTIGANAYVRHWDAFDKLFKNKGQRMLTSGVCLFHDNVCHTLHVSPLRCSTVGNGMYWIFHCIAWSSYPVIVLKNSFFTWRNIWSQNSLTTMMRWRWGYNVVKRTSADFYELEIQKLFKC